MWKLLAKSLGVAGLIILVMAAGAWVAFPHLAGPILERFVKAPASVKIRAGRPGWSALEVPFLEIAASGFRVTVNGARLEYAPSLLWQGRFDRVTVSSLIVTLEETGEAREGAPQLPNPWTLTPASHLVVDTFEIRRDELALTGRAELAPRSLAIESALHSPRLADTVELVASIAADGGARIRVGPGWVSGEAKLGDAGDRLVWQGQVQIDRPAAETLLDALGVKEVGGDLAGEFEATLPWPMIYGEALVDALMLTARLDIEAEADVPEVGRTRVEAALELELAEQALIVRARNARASIAEGQTVKGWRFEGPAAYAGDVDLQLPLRALTAGPGALAGAVTASGAGSFTLDASALAPARQITSSGTGTFRWQSFELIAEIADESNARIATGGSTFAAVLTEAVKVSWSGRSWQTGATSMAVQLPGTTLMGQEIGFDDVLVELGAITAAGEEISISARMGTLSGDGLALDADAVIQLTEGFAAKFEVSVDHSIQGPFLHRQLAGWESEWDLDAGELTIEGAGSIAAGGVFFDGTAALAAARGHYGDIVATGISVRMPFRWDDGKFVSGPGPIAAEALSAVVSATNIHAMAAVGPETLAAEALVAEVLGGTVRVPEIHYDLGAGETVFRIELAGIDLASVLALEGKQLRGSGSLDGHVVVTVDDGRIIAANGEMAARPPGGDLAYLGSMGGGETPGLDLATKALRDFDYSELMADIVYAPSGDMDLAVKLRGSSPDVEQGRPIHFNLNITENLPALFRSLRTAREINRQVQDKFSE